MYNLDLIEKAGGISFVIIPTNGISKVKKYIAKHFPDYTHIRVIDLNQLKKLVTFLKGYESIRSDLVF